MELVKPLPFTEALDKIGRKSLVGSDLTSEQWGAVPVALRERAFFSARVESARFLQRARDGIADFLAGNRETLPNGQVAVKTGGRAAFVKQAQDFLIAEGAQRTTGGLTDITSQKRLELIFDTQIRQSHDYGNWLQGQDPDVLNEFPAQRFIRVIEVKEPRSEHSQYEGAVALKSDVAFWTRINQDFGVPWGPWGWGCGHDVEDVDRDEAERLGLIGQGQQPQPAVKQFNDDLAASTRGLDGDLLQWLADSFGDQVEFDGDQVKWATRLTPDVARVLQGRPTLDTALQNAGIAGRTDVTEMDMRRFIEELKEEHPLQASQVLSQVNAPVAGLMNQSQITAQTQEFLNFVPAHKARVLPKITTTVKHVPDQLGSYLNGQMTLDPLMAAKDAKRITFHEMAHWLHLDGDPAWRAEIKKHFRDRTQGESTEQLVGYSKGVVGRKDRWYNSYAGRIYNAYYDSGDGDGVEIPSRYLELLSSPAELAFRWQDADFRETMMIALRGLF